MFDETPEVAAAEERIAADIAKTLARGPRRFAVFAVTPDDAELLGWGLDFGDEAVFVNGGGAVFHSSSAVSVAWMLGQRGDVRLEWPDGT
jgi:hypothetical protein